MGYESQCAYRVDGQARAGRAHLELHALVVRGSPRLSIPLATVKAASAHAGWLTVVFDGGVAELELGADAARWAKRITSPPSRLAKLGVRPGQRVLIVGSVDEAFVDEIGRTGAIVLKRAPATPVDVVFYAVDRPAALGRLASLASSLAPRGALWTLRPKGQGGISEAATMAAGREAGLVDVKVVSFSETLTAEKFVIPAARRVASGRRAAIRAR